MSYWQIVLGRQLFIRFVSGTIGVRDNVKEYM